MKIEDIQEIELAMNRRISSMPTKIRPFTREIGTLPRALMLTGPRGVGKTTFLLHHAKGRKILYFSADNPIFSGEPLYNTIKAICMAGYEGVIIDEVHHARDWSLHLKAIYDDFPAHFFWVSDSSSLILRSGIGDTSRRYVPIRMPLLSFREFLYLETGAEYHPYEPFGTLMELPLQPSPAVLDAFRKYRVVGTRPFYSEGNFADRMLAILDKTLYTDVPYFLPALSDGNLRLMKAITGTLASASIPRLQVRSLCSDWGIGAEKLYQILNVMESVGVLRIIRTENDTKAKTAGDKLFFADPSYYTVFRGDSGTAREALVAAFFEEAGWVVESAKDDSTGDFVVSRRTLSAMEKIKIEVGGASKKLNKADFVIRDDIDYPASKTIPLWLAGMAW